MIDAANAVGGRELVGRAAEQGRLFAFASFLAGGPRALLLRGEPGIGKTMLWRYGVRRCREAGLTVLVTRPAEEDLPLALVGVVDLFEHDVLDTETLRTDGDPLERGRAVLAAVQRLAAERAVVIAVDDLQWLDSASARALTYALRKLTDEPVGVLATARPGADRRVVDGLGSSRVEALDLAPLGLDDLRRMLEGTVAAIPRPTLRRIHEISGGNPLFALELARSLRSVEHSDAGLALPHSLQAVIGVRLAAAPAELAPVLEAAAAVGPASISELRAALPDRNVDALLALAAEHELLVVEDGDVRFVHPLVASVVYGRMGPLERRRLHAGLAADAVDPDVRARHLALSADEPDEATATLLEEAAGRARSRGAFDIAAELGRHSVRLTPGAGTEDRCRRALAQVADLAKAGDVGRAIGVSNRLIEELPPGPARAEALVQHSDLETDHPELVIASLERALEDAGGEGPLRATVLQELGLSRFLCLGDLRGALVDVREAATLVAHPGDARQAALAEACLAHLEAIAGRPNPEVMARTAALEDELATARLSWRPRVLLAKQRRWAGELEAARTLRAGGDSRTENQRPYRLYDLALIECSAGDFAAADELVKQGLEAARDAGDGFGERAFWYPLGLIQAWLGHAEGARETARRLLDRAEPLGDRLDVVASRRILGLVALAEGDYGSAVQELGQGARLLREIGIGNPGFYPVLPDAVEALARTGDLTGAVELLERLHDQAASVGSAWAATVAERCHGLVLLSGGETEAAASLLERAAASFDGLGHRPDAARAVLALGQAHWRGGRRTLATAALEDARERFARMGASLWEQRAFEELARVSKQCRTDDLTPVERRVAALVASGRKNREVAQELFVSIATVEAHLTRIYRKLEIRSRSELARALDGGA